MDMREVRILNIDTARVTRWKYRVCTSSSRRNLSLFTT